MRERDGEEEMVHAGGRSFSESSDPGPSSGRDSSDAECTDGDRRGQRMLFSESSSKHDELRPDEVAE